MINEDESTAYISTKQVPGMLIDEYNERWSESAVRQWIARPPNENPLRPDLPGRSGQSHLFRRETIRAWHDAERARTIVARIRVKIARRRRLGLPVLGEGP